MFLELILELIPTDVVPSNSGIESSSSSFTRRVASHFYFLLCIGATDRGMDWSFGSAAVAASGVGTAAVSVVGVGVAALLIGGDRVAALSVALPSDSKTSFSGQC